MPELAFQISHNARVRTLVFVFKWSWINLIDVFAAPPNRWNPGTWKRWWQTSMADSKMRWRQLHPMAQQTLLCKYLPDIRWAQECSRIDPHTGGGCNNKCQHTGSPPQWRLEHAWKATRWLSPRTFEAQHRVHERGPKGATMCGSLGNSKLGRKGWAGLHELCKRQGNFCWL